MDKYGYNEPDGKLSINLSVGADGVLNEEATWSPRNTNRDREIGPAKNGTERDHKMTIANKYELGDTPSDDPSLGNAGGNTSTYYPQACHLPLTHTTANYARLCEGGLMDNNRD